MKVVIDGKTAVVAKGSTVADSARKLGLNPETFLFSRGNEIIHENEALREGDKIKLIKVVSGG